MKSSIIALLLIALNPICSFAQNENSTSSTSDFNTTFAGSTANNTTGLWVPTRKKDTSIEGTPYLFSNWNGLYTVVNKKGNKFKVLNLNYNVESKIMETQFTKDSLFQYHLPEIDYVQANNKNYRIIENEMFLELYNGGDFKLLKQFSVTINEGVSNPLSGADLTARRYVLKEEYKLHKSENLSKFKLNKSSMLKLFSEKSDAITKFVKENKLSYSEERDVIRILNYISTI